MKIKKRSISAIFAVILMLTMLIGVMPLVVSAAYDPNMNPDDYMDENSYYTVTESCGGSGSVLGSFNGSAACVSASGELHLCAKNFPDTSFRGFIITVLKGYGSDKTLTEYYSSQSEVNAITWLDPGRTLATDLCTFKGIEYFVNLEKLDIFVCVWA